MKKIKIDRAIQERPATRKQTRNEKIRQSLTEHVDVQVIPAITDREGYEKPKLRVCAYCRVSTDMDTQALSYELQVQNYTDYIRGNDEWQFAGIYADRGISGTSLKHRDEFNRMIEDCKAGKIDLIITKGQVDFAGILVILERMAVVILLTAAAQWIMNACNNKITYNVIRDIRKEAFERIEHLPLKYIDSHSYGEVVSRVIADVDQFADGLLMGFTQFFTGIVTIFGTLIFMLTISVNITVAVVVITPLSLLSLIHI